MKMDYNESGKIETTFSSEEERETLFKVFQRLRPYVLRGYCNVEFIKSATGHGWGYSESICKAFGVDPDGKKWEKEEEK